MAARLRSRAQRLPAPWLAIALLAACGPGPRGDGVPVAAVPVSDREQVLGPFLSAHWRLPVAVQGAAPEAWSELEASLAPERCGACHPIQYRDWQTSLHAGAFSPGFAGQLIEGSLSAPSRTRSCQRCHAPLGEQQPFGAAGDPEPAFDAELRTRGITCAACHVRAHRRFGPPRRPGLPPPATPLPHGGFEARREFQESRFCSPCHQFFGDPGVEGKPLENTWVEWRASPQAAEGRSCQSCHMPDRAHLWRGIHDPETVRAAVDVDLASTGGSAATLPAALVLSSRDVGHAFPSYVTPRVFLALWQADAAGMEIPGTRAEAALGREIDFHSHPHREVFDTRLAPGESARLDYARAAAPGAVALVGRVTVDPDHHYRGVFDRLLRRLRDEGARARIEEARRRCDEARYVLTEIRRPLAPGERRPAH